MPPFGGCRCCCALARLDGIVVGWLLLFVVVAVVVVVVRV